MSFQELLLEKRENRENRENGVLAHSDLEVMYDSDIDRQIIRERNEDVQRITNDMEALSEISLQMKELVFEQGDDLIEIDEKVEVAEENVEQSTQNLDQAETFSNKLKNIFAKGALVSTGVTGAGAVTGLLINPIAGGVAMAIGIGGIVVCILKMV